MPIRGATRSIGRRVRARSCLAPLRGLPPVLLGEAGDREQVGAGLVEHRGRVGELLFELQLARLPEGRSGRSSARLTTSRLLGGRTTNSKSWEPEGPPHDS